MSVELMPERESSSGQDLWGTVEFWAEESGLPIDAVRERLEVHHPRLMRMQDGETESLSDVYSEAAFLESCADLLILRRDEARESLQNDRVGLEHVRPIHEAPVRG
jgi:hypothetical protein